MEKELKEQESYRDHIATVDHKSGKRLWIYPKKPKGQFYNYRKIVSIVLLVGLFGVPFIKINGDPLFLFNIIERHFIILGVVFTPQDLHLLALAMITLVLFIVLFTVVFGRLFCGWICPQTIFMEMVFRKIEYWIEGDANQQRKLDNAPWTPEKAVKKIGKHLIFFSIAVLIANTFLSYIIGVDEVMKIVSEPIALHTGGFMAMLIFSSIFYFVFARFREQVCIVVCPYGRLQSVLLVKESIVVAYDWIRGEPRGKIKKKSEVEEQAPMGDCVNCHLCVKVCPTGIDIRNGTQLECINCTACIDACDEVMIKVGRDPGLIRYDSFTGIEKGSKKLITARVKAYAAVLLALIVLQGFLFTARSDVEAVVLRTPGMLYQKIDENTISNLYNFQVINKTTKDIENISFRILGENGEIRIVGKVPVAPKMGMAEGAFFVDMKTAELTNRKTRVKIEVFSGEDKIDDVKTNFLGPPK